jgi:hypothetical protein
MLSGLFCDARIARPSCFGPRRIGASIGFVHGMTSAYSSEDHKGPCLNRSSSLNWVP